jgi:adenosyl cobinamide kinase/adenosyl cobinamide phosphate guanylyltransferase
MTATEQVSEWTQERINHAQKRLAQISRHAVKTAVPNLLNQQEADDVALIIDSYEEYTAELPTDGEPEVSSTEGELSTSEVVD